MIDRPRRLTRSPSFRWLLLLAIPFAALSQKKAGDHAAVPDPARTSTNQGASPTIAANSRAPLAIERTGALVPIFERFYRLSAGEDPAPVHIVHFGDSHSAADDWTGELRRLLKEKFGDGGSGFSLAGRPFAGYRRYDVQEGGSAGWRSDGLRSGAGDGFFGLGGISISTRTAGQSVFIETNCDRLEIDYLQQPDGGDVALYDRDELLQKLSTSGELGPGIFTYQPAKGAHHFILKTLDSKSTRLFGWVADKNTGVTYESLGINGTEASVILHWDENMFATYLERRSPGLVVLAYGTNEAFSGAWSAEKYQAMFSNVLRRIRLAAPAASILILGPPDSWSSHEGKLRPAAGLDRIIGAQKAACREIGCAFWDTRGRMGGPGSMREWVQAGLAQRDYVHFTPTGYRRLGTMLFEDLMRDYDLFMRVRQEISVSASR
jgi:lysophospholipase L1-like esterase